MKKLMLVSICALAVTSVFAAKSQVVIPMYDLKTNAYVGSVTAQDDSPYGLLLTPNLKNLSPELAAGPHGFHVHENPSCAEAGAAAGGHLDPKKTGHHMGPYNKDGHLGDLPALSVDANGNADVPVVAPKLKLKDILNRSLMIHEGSDNYSDTPPMGGGGKRVICGVIPAKATSL